MIELYNGWDHTHYVGTGRLSYDEIQRLDPATSKVYNSFGELVSPEMIVNIKALRRVGAAFSPVEVLAFAWSLYESGSITIYQLAELRDALDIAFNGDDGMDDILRAHSKEDFDALYLYLNWRQVITNSLHQELDEGLHAEE